MSLQIPLHYHSFAVEWLPEHSIQICSTSWLSHGCSLLCRPIPVVWIHQGSSPTAKMSPYTVALFWWLCASPSPVHHLRSAGPALSLGHLYLPNSPHHPYLQHYSDLSQIATIIDWKVFSGSQFNNQEFSAIFVSSCSSWTTVSPVSSSFLHQLFLSQHNPPSISLSLHSLWSAFLAVSWPEASFLITNCAIPQRLGLFHLPSRSCLHSLDDIIGWTAWLVYYICPPEVGNVLFGALTIVVCVDFLLGQDVGCCKLWTIWRQAASFMPMLIRLIILNNAKSPFWLSINRD